MERFIRLFGAVFREDALPIHWFRIPWGAEPVVFPIWLSPACPTARNCHPQLGNLDVRGFLMRGVTGVQVSHCSGFCVMNGHFIGVNRGCSAIGTLVLIDFVMAAASELARRFD